MLASVFRAATDFLALPPAALLRASSAWPYIVESASIGGFGVSQPSSFAEYQALIASHPVVSRCVTLRSQYVSRGRLRFYRGEEEDEITEGPLPELFRHVNPEWTLRGLILATVMDLDLTGNAFWELVRVAPKKGAKAMLLGVPVEVIEEGDGDLDPMVETRSGFKLRVPAPLIRTPVRELWRLNAARMTIEPNPEGISRYIYTVNGRPAYFTPESVVHFRYHDPVNDFYGLSPLRAITRTIVGDELEEKTRNAILKNGARPSGVMTYDPNTSDDQLLAAVKMFKDAYSGADNAGKTMHVAGGREYKALTMTSVEMQSVDMKRLNKATIMQAFGVDSIVYGMDPGDTSATRENTRNQWLVFHERTALPIAEQLQDTITEQVFPRLGMGDLSSVRAALDYSHTRMERQLAAEEAVAWEPLMKLGTVSPNETRLMLSGRRPKFDPLPEGDNLYGPMSLVVIGNTQKELPAPEPPKALPPAPPEDVAQPSPEDEMDMKALSGLVKRARVLVPALTRATITPADIAAAAEFPEDDPELRRMRALFESILASNGEAALAEIGIDIAFNVETPELQKYLETKTIQFADVALNRYSEDVREALLEGEREGETIQELADRVNAVFAGRKDNALTVARTECLPGSALVDGAVIEAVHRRWYEGPMVEVVTTGGRKFSATPNHPMLTQRGWVGAGSLCDGDDLVCDGRHKNPRSAGDEDVNAGPATLAEIFDTVKAIGISERRRGAKPDFHGDGMDGDVDILRPDRALRIGSFAAVYKPVIDQVLTESDRSRAPICQECGRLLSIDKQACRCRTTHANSVPYSAYDGRLRDAEGIGDGSGSFAGGVATGNRGNVHRDVVMRSEVANALYHESPSLAARTKDASITNDAHHPGRVVAGAVVNHRQAESGTVQLDRVITLRVIWFAGHVYNLSTPYGYYTANLGIFTGNTAGSANFGRMEAYEQAGLEEHQWVTSRDDVVRDSHQALEGEVVRIGEAFGNGQRFPGETVGEVGEFANCRCDLVAVIPGGSRPEERFLAGQWRAFVTRLDADERAVKREFLRLVDVQARRVLARLRERGA